MKLKNLEIYKIYNCYAEIIGSIEAKKEIPGAGKIIYEITNKFNELTPIIEDVSKQEQLLRKNAGQLVNEPDGKEVQGQLKIDLNKLHDTENDIEPYKLNQPNCEILAKYLTGTSTLILFNHLSIK